MYYDDAEGMWSFSSLASVVFFVGFVFLVSTFGGGIKETFENHRLAKKQGNYDGKHLKEAFYGLIGFFFFLLLLLTIVWILRRLGI